MFLSGTPTWKSRNESRMKTSNVPLSWNFSLDVRMSPFSPFSFVFPRSKMHFEKWWDKKKLCSRHENAFENPIERLLPIFSSSSIRRPRTPLITLNFSSLDKTNWRPIDGGLVSINQNSTVHERLLRRSLFCLIRYHGRCTVTSFIAPTKVPFNRRYSTWTRVLIPAYFPVCEFVFLIYAVLLTEFYSSI